MSFDFNKIKYIIFGILIIICVILGIRCYNLSRENKIYENNIESLTDSIEIIKLSNNELMYSKQSLILEKNELEKYLGISKKEVNEIERKLNSSLAYISKLEGNVTIDTIILKDTFYVNDDIMNLDFSYSDKWISLNGSSKIQNNESNTTMNYINMEIPLKVGITDDYDFFASTECPYVNFSEITSSAIDKSVVHEKDKRWGLSFYVGCGIGYGYATDFKGNNVSGGLITGLTAGFSINYNFLKW